jgi:glutaredoxin
MVYRAHCGLVVYGAPSVSLPVLTRLALEARVRFTYIPEETQNPPVIRTDRGEAAVELTASPEALREASHTECRTAVVPLGYDVTALVREGVTFRVADVSSPMPSLPDSQLGTPRTPTAILPGLLLLGTRTCPHTLAAAQAAASSEVPFYYIDITGRMGQTHEAFVEILEQPYYFSDQKPPNGMHTTVPIVLLNGKLVGGRAELEEALKGDGSRETLEQQAHAANGAIVYLSLGGVSQKSLEKALKAGKVVRVV